MEVAYVTYVIIIFWLLLAIPYWNLSHCVESPTNLVCHVEYYFANIYKPTIIQPSQNPPNKSSLHCSLYGRLAHNNDQNNSKLGINKLNEKIVIFKIIDYLFFLTFPPQAQFVHKWNRVLLTTKRRTSQAIENNLHMFFLCKMSHSRSLKKIFDGVKYKGIFQTKKHTSSIACLSILDKTKPE